MTLTVTGRRVAVTDAIRDQIERRLRRLERVLQARAVSGQCVLIQDKQGVACELTIQVAGGGALHGLGRDRRLAAAVGGAAEKVAQQAVRLADRQRTRRRASRDRRTPAGPAEAPAPPPGPRIIRSAPAAVRPMSLDDAALALEASRQPVFVFRHAGTERIAVLFRRADGHYGLVEPEA